MPDRLSPLAPGVEVDGFVVQRVVGTGGFGITYEATDASLDRRVALKEYYPGDIASRGDDGMALGPRSELLGDDYQYGLERFLDEARVLARFQSPSVVRVVRFLEANGTAYLVMEYEDGRSMADHIRSSRGLGEDVVRPWLVALLRGLSEVHEKGYLHRDIKPANVIIRPDGSPVLLDFGAARDAIGAATDSVTVIFTPGYAPFEQYATTAKLGPWTDLYAAGATIVHALVGKLPMAATDRMVAIDTGEPDPVPAMLDPIRADLSDDFHRALLWMLAPRATERAQSAEAVLTALGEPVSQRDSGAGVPRTTDSGPRTHTQRATIAADFEKSLELVGQLENLLEPVLGTKAQQVVRPAVEMSSSYDELLDALGGMVPDTRTRVRFRDAALAIRNGGEPVEEPDAAKSRAPLFAAAAAGLVLVAGGAWWTLGSSPDVTTAEPVADAAPATATATATATTTAPAPALAPVASEPTPEPVATPEPAVTQPVAPATAAAAPSNTPAPAEPSFDGDELSSGGVGPAMVPLEPGRYLIGSPGNERGRDADEEPMLGLDIPAGIALSRHEITRSDFSRFVEATGFQTTAEQDAERGCMVEADGWQWRPGASWRDPGFPQTADEPVVCVSWDDAMAYTRWLSRETGRRYELPSEAVWEYAARAGTTGSRYWTDGGAACRFANVSDLTRARMHDLEKTPANVFLCVDNHAYTSPVGAFEANEFHLHDVLGNVWEWTADCWRDSYQGLPTDGSARIDQDCELLVFRGGSWINTPQFVRSASRAADRRTGRYFNVGFRLMRRG